MPKNTLEYEKFTVNFANEKTLNGDGGDDGGE